MDLWIRSQDRKKLVKVDRLAIDDTNSIFCDYNDFFLASYKTKESALKILDEITGILTLLRTSEKKSNCFVYNMPIE